MLLVYNNKLKTIVKKLTGQLFLDTEQDANYGDLKAKCYPFRQNW